VISRLAIAVQEACLRFREKMQEDKAKKILFRSAFGTQKSGWLRNAFDMRLKNPANTNAVIWGGRLLALWEVRLHCSTNLECLLFGRLEGLEICDLTWEP
jgi:carotenoid cleavage dioxygenase-like enzyme